MIQTNNFQEIPTVLDGKKVNMDVKTLRAQIPSHCFEPSVLRSTSYIVRDAIVLSGIIAATLFSLKHVDGWQKIAIQAIIYPYIASLPMTGLWVIGHEAGHGGFSAYNALNNLVGFIIHSALFVPFFSWRSSHGRHHQYANNMSVDLNYVPPHRDEYKELLKGKVDMEHMVEDAPLVVFLRIVLQQVIGFPYYLLTHITAAPNSSPKPSRGWWDNSHFMPNSSLFRTNEFWKIFVSDLGVAAVCAALYYGGEKFGSWTMIWMYVLPWGWVNHWVGK